MSKTFDKIKQKWNENPLEVIAIGATVATAAAMLINAMSATQSRHAYAKQVKMRERNYNR